MTRISGSYGDIRQGVPFRSRSKRDMTGIYQKKVKE